MTLEDFKGKKAKYKIMAEDLRDGEVFEAVPERAIADIASQFCVSNDTVLDMLQKNYDDRHNAAFIQCSDKNADFWVEETK